MISKKDIHTFEGAHRVLLRANEFICLLPHPNLRECISNYNITFPTKDLMPVGFTTMPCGCATLTVGSNNNNLSVELDGPATRPYIFDGLINELEMIVTIEFKPAGLYTLTGISQSELADRSVSFEATDPKLSKLISDAVEKADSIHELITSLDMLLLKNIYTVCHPQLLLTLQNIVGCAGNTTVKRLSDDIHYSQRQLSRIFRQHVGVSAKSFARLIRINSAFHLLKKPNASLTFASDVMGFHDLSHFIRDFKSVCGITPQEYRDNMSDFYINPKKF